MKITKVILIIAGFMFFGLGTIGIYLPFLPTTPFYLLATLCFTRGSERLYNWLTGTRLYKKHIEKVIKNKSMTLKTKLVILVPVSLWLLLTAIMVDVFVMRVMLITLVIVKNWYFIFRIKTIPSGKNNGIIKS